MRSAYPLGVLVLSLAGCSGVVENEHHTPDATDKPSASATARIEGDVSARFPPGDSRQCRPMGFPVTDFLSGAFKPDDLVQDEVVSNSETCVHAQVLSAPADSWAAFVYNVLCEGGGDIRLCRATETRLCSLETLMKWAEPRTNPAPARDHTFGFDYLIPPLDDTARIALYRRARQEAQALVDEATEVNRKRTEGTRNCPTEDEQGIRAASVEGEETERQIDDLLGVVSTKVRF